MSEPFPLSEPHWLYACYSATRGCLYVGISRRPQARFAQHAGEKEWWDQVRAIEMEWYPDRGSCLDAERHAIRAQRPVHNVQHNLDAFTRALEPVPEAEKVCENPAELFRAAMLKRADSWMKQLLEVKGFPNTMPVSSVAGIIWALDRQSRGEL
jgi:predicted GIY-YIG superfamily endonuclease